jgi:hypothetical protein
MEEYGLNTNIQHGTATRRSFQKYDELSWVNGRPHFNYNWCTTNKSQPSFGNLHNISEQTVTLK